MCDVPQDKKLISIFIVFSSAFYSVNWEAMESILLKGFLSNLRTWGSQIMSTHMATIPPADRIVLKMMFNIKNKFILL